MQENIKRNDEVAKLFEQGWSYVNIGAKYKISRARVQQIILKRYGKDAVKIRNERLIK